MYASTVTVIKYQNINISHSKSITPIMKIKLFSSTHSTA